MHKSLYTSRKDYPDDKEYRGYTTAKAQEYDYIDGAVLFWHPAIDSCKQASQNEHEGIYQERQYKIDKSGQKSGIICSKLRIKYAGHVGYAGGMCLSMEQPGQRIYGQVRKVKQRAQETQNHGDIQSTSEKILPGYIIKDCHLAMFFIDTDTYHETEDNAGKTNAGHRERRIVAYNGQEIGHTDKQKYDQSIDREPYYYVLHLKFKYFLHCDTSLLIDSFSFSFM